MKRAKRRRFKGDWIPFDIRDKGTWPREEADYFVTDHEGDYGVRHFNPDEDTCDSFVDDWKRNVQAWIREVD